MADTWPTTDGGFGSSLLSAGLAGLQGGLPGIAASLGAGLAGKLFGKKDNSVAYWNEVSYNETRRQFDELQHHKIKNAANDARAAGLHPLFALGGAGAAGSPVAFMPGQSYTGSASSDVAVGFSEAMRGAAEAMFPQAQRADPESQSRIDANMAEAAYYRSLARRADAEMNSKQDAEAVTWDKVVDDGRPEPVRIFTPYGDSEAESGRWSSEEWSNEYGEIAGEIGGVMNAGEDFGRPLGRAVYDFLHGPSPRVPYYTEQYKHPGRKNEWRP